MKITALLESFEAPLIGKVYNVDWDGPSLVKVYNVRGVTISIVRVDKNGKDLPGVENKMDVTPGEWKGLEPTLIGKKEEPKKVQEDRVELLKRAANQLIRELKTMPQGRHVRSGDVYPPEVNPHKKTQVEVAIRYWGDWSNPEDAEDEEDYDWQVLSKKSGEVLDKFVKEFAKKNDVKLRWTPEEKNYINFSLE